MILLAYMVRTYRVLRARELCIMILYALVVILQSHDMIYKQSKLNPHVRRSDTTVDDKDYISVTVD